MSIRRGPALWLVLSGGLLIAAIAIGTALVIGEFREQALLNSERELENTVQLLTRHFDQQFEDCDIITSDLISKLQLSEIASPEAFKGRMSGLDAHLMLKSKTSPSSYIGDVNIFDANGELINSSGDGPLPAGTTAERSYFKAFKSDPRSADVAVEPVRALFTGNWSTVFARRLAGPGGVFLGAMGRRIDPATFEKFFASVALGEGAAISMLHRDGTMLARHPHVESMIGQNFSSAPLMVGVLDQGGHASRREQSPVDGQDRLASAAQLHRFPIVIVASKTVSAALADWRAQTRFMIAAASLSVLVIIVMLFVIVRRLTEQHRESQQRLEQEKHRLDTALNNMTQGLVLFDASARVVLCNQRYIGMYGLSTAVIKPGIHFHDVLRHR
ncbi:MAG TPA: cache domain-containing protein, partial [Bradyrhizobium sp.]|nr:cache domain-containing protein [Bradyrhizobium sp.]